MLFGFQLLPLVSSKLMVMASDVIFSVPPIESTRAFTVIPFDPGRPKLVSTTISPTSGDVVASVMLAGAGAFFFSGLRRIGSKTMLLSFSGGASSTFSSEKKLIVCSDRRRVFGFDLCAVGLGREGDSVAFVTATAGVAVVVDDDVPASSPKSDGAPAAR